MVCPFADPDSSDSDVTSVLRLAGFAPDRFAVSYCARSVVNRMLVSLEVARASAVNPSAAGLLQEVLYVVGRSHSCRRTT